MRPVAHVITGSATSGVDTSKVVRNTYTLLAMTLLFSAVTAGISMAIQPPMFTGIVCSLGALAMIWLVLPKTANSGAGIGVVFAITGLLGFGLGPLLTHYLAMPNGGSVVAMAMGSTAAIFLGLTGYVMVTKKDFSFMGGFLMIGILVAFLAGIGAAVFNVPGLSLAVSAVFIMLMGGKILYDTSALVHGGETNYIMATVSLYVSIYNLFLSLLHLLSAFAGER